MIGSALFSRNHCREAPTCDTQLATRIARTALLKKVKGASPSALDKTYHGLPRASRAASRWSTSIASYEGWHYNCLFDFGGHPCPKRKPSRKLKRTSVKGKPPVRKPASLSMKRLSIYA